MTIQNNPNKHNEIDVIIEYDVKYSPRVKNDFAKFIRHQLKEYNDEFGEELKVRDLADQVGIGYEMFRKILNKQKPTDKRDCIIAICTALHLMSHEIDDALILYGYMSPLSEDNPRDKFIMTQVNSDSGISVAELNESLIQRGFPGLNIHEKRDGKNENTDEREMRIMPYKITKEQVRTPISDYYYGDPYNSLCTTYNPNYYKSTGDMVIQNVATKEFIHLTVHSDGCFYSCVIQRDDCPMHYNTLEDTGDYREYFAELKQTVFLEKERLFSVLNDTKNYKIRTSARLIVDAISVFSEEFNYTIPELNEYYLMELSKGKYKLYVYHQSVFMRKYLSENEFKKYYCGKYNIDATEIYDSVQQIDDMLAGKNAHTDESIRLRMRKRAFVNMQKNVDALYEELRTRKQFIQNLRNTYDNPYDVLRYYNLEDEFECKYDEEFLEIIDSLPSKEFALPNGTKIEITVEDIQHAFELGYENIEQICELKAKLGSVDAVL